MTAEDPSAAAVAVAVAVQAAAAEGVQAAAGRPLLFHLPARGRAQ